MNYTNTIKAALAHIGKTQAWLAQQMGYKTPQALNQRMRTGKWSYEELEQMGQILGAKFVARFEFPDGTTV